VDPPIHHGGVAYFIQPWKPVHGGGKLGNPGDIPRFQVNKLYEPTGEFYDHMKQFAFDQASKEFPWHLDWNK
jgi:hypothetical protein